MLDAAYVLLLDGVPVLFASRDLGDAWAIAQGWTRLHAGLQLPRGIAAGVDLRGGDWTDSTAQLELVDVDDTLPRVFSAGDEGEPLIVTIEPGDVAPSPTWGRWVGSEAIGPAGERRRWSCWPGFAVGGRHLGQLEASALGQTRAVSVTASPRQWDGLRWSLWRLDAVDVDEWPDLEGAHLVGVGVLLGPPRVDGRTWSLRVTGPEGWIGGTAGPARTSEPVPVAPITRIGDGPDDGRLLASLELVDLSTQNVLHAWVPTDAALEVLVPPGEVTYADLAAAFGELLDVVQDDAGSGTAYRHGASASRLRYVTTAGADGVSVRWNRDEEVAAGHDPANFGTTPRLQVTAPEPVWAGLGFDVRAQVTLDPSEHPEAFAIFEAASTPGHWTGVFFAADHVAMLGYITQDWAPVVVDPDDPSDHYTNFQADRRWAPAFAGGACAWTMVAGQQFQLRTFDPVYWLGVASRPLPADPADATKVAALGGGIGDVTHQGLVLVEGPYRWAGGGEVDAASPLEAQRGQTVQVFRVGWRANAEGSVDTDSDGWPRALVYEVLEPREFGVPWPRLEGGTWSGWIQPPIGTRGFVARPLFALEWHTGEGQRVDLIALRAMLTTGTRGRWVDADAPTEEIFGLAHPSPSLEAGANDMDGAGLPLDAEVAELGLAIPAGLVADPSTWAQVVAAVGPQASRAKVAISTATSWRALFRSLLGALGLAPSWSGGRFGVRDATRWPSPAEAVLVLTPQLHATRWADDAYRVSQEARPAAPIDVFEIAATRNPAGSDYAQRWQRLAQTPGTRYRAQTITHRIDGAYFVHHLAGIPGSAWAGDLEARTAALAAWWESDMAELVVRLDTDLARHLRAGDAVMVTDPWIADRRAGLYGLAQAVGLVTRTVWDAVDEVLTATVLVSLRNAATLYARAALATWYDADGLEIGVVDSWLGTPGFDAAAFVEPDWSTAGGAMAIEAFAWGGGALTRGIFGEVVGVQVAEGDCRLQLAAPLSGAAWLRDRWHVIVPRRLADQTAPWVAVWLAAIADEVGLLPDASAGKPFV